MAEFNNMRVLHEEKREECLKLQTDFKELEDRFFHSKTREKENADQQLKVYIFDCLIDLLYSFLIFCFAVTRFCMVFNMVFNMGYQGSK